MMVVTVLGLGDASHREVLRRVSAAIAESARAAEVETCTDFDRMITHGAYVPPAVLVDGALRSVGRTPSAAELRDWLSTDRYGEDSGAFQVKTYKKRLERAGE
jgi:hypothetical protein